MLVFADMISTTSATRPLTDQSMFMSISQVWKEEGGGGGGGVEHEHYLAAAYWETYCLQHLGNSQGVFVQNLRKDRLLPFNPVCCKVRRSYWWKPTECMYNLLMVQIIWKTVQLVLPCVKWNKEWNWIDVLGLLTDLEEMSGHDWNSRKYFFKVCLLSIIQLTARMSWRGFLHTRKLYHSRLANSQTYIDAVRARLLFLQYGVQYEIVQSNSFVQNSLSLYFDTLIEMKLCINY